eukprot:CAMPEP_0114360692 /NCGR_PEP_ID=MMETSP0101-20121206/24053_1 /TAXON_ID=38822 ORGANISM="Pteridomonas danica, Strain PT" /NCGR_SAMPLE_ID=MMETSP0101 /ASSEMBLY_ACC=CAM_ASM_000211 /LENGTH=198 /DNA_ID=CAMNT_0001505053 /DNA_START=116 /DNA_END=712 /DNA_ORIENTATION=-
MIMKGFDKDGSNSLNHDEVMDMCTTLTNEVAPNIGVSEEDIDMVMRVGGKTAKAEITHQDIPLALSAVLALKKENIFLHELFIKYDVDKSNSLPKDQLSNLLTEFNDGIRPTSDDIDYIIDQCDISGTHAIEENEIKGAITAWYCLVDENDPPSSIEEAKRLGYSDEEIAEYLEMQKAEEKEQENESKSEEGKEAEAK